MVPFRRRFKILWFRLSKPIEIIDVYLGSQTSVDSDTLFFNTSNYQLRYWPYRDLQLQQNYTPLGLSRSGIDRTIDSSIDSLNIILDNVSRTFSTLFNTDDFRGKRIVIRQVYQDVLSASGDYDLLFDGILDRPESDGQGNVKFEIKHNVIESLNAELPKEYEEEIVAKVLKEWYEVLSDYQPISKQDKKDTKKDLKAIKRVHNYCSIPQDWIK